MKSTKLLLFVTIFYALSTSLISCEPKSPVFEKYLKLTNSTWDRFDIKHFEIPVEEADKSYNITVVVRCSEQFKSENIPFYVILTSPSGEESIREVTVPIRENGKLITDPNTAKPESRLVLWQNINIAKGKSKISIENMIPRIQTAGIDEVGILVTKSK